MNDKDALDDAGSPLRLPIKDAHQTVWDAMTVGLPAKDKARAERILLQAGYKLSDPIATVAGFLGWIESLSVSFPRDMEGRLSECSASVARSALMFKEAVERLHAWESQFPERVSAMEAQAWERLRQRVDASVAATAQADANAMPRLASAADREESSRPTSPPANARSRVIGLAKIAGLLVVGFIVGLACATVFP